MSGTLAPDTDPTVTVVPGDPAALARELKKEESSGLDIRLCGGGKLAGAGSPGVDGAFDPTAFGAPSAPPSPTASPSPAAGACFREGSRVVDSGVPRPLGLPDRP
ncbi:hypothetical protein [Kitasatospora sp. DSM 101779]|uniref:hypothetical protein n=1 Tax=Kitasatospora sp. DSM 101779 TaxID=2853165 RepID=UPI0021D7D618|nr:hypothetical protein [Kitasatospora sp. DSM 101779]